MKNPKLFAALAGLLVLAGTPLFLPECAASPSRPALTQDRTSSMAIPTADVDATARWYAEHLGFRKLGERSTVQGRRVVLERAGLLVEVTEHDAPVRSAHNIDVDTTGSLAAPALVILVSDIDAEMERLRARGVTILEDPDDDLEGRFRIGAIRDNNGRSIELREPLAQGSGERP